MSRLLDDLYPTFRLFLYDGRMRYSVPYTIFGSIRAAIYVGDMYLVLNATQPVLALTRHFDNLIRSAIVNPHESAAFARTLVVSEPSARRDFEVRLILISNSCEFQNRDTAGSH